MKKSISLMVIIFGVSLGIFIYIYVAFNQPVELEIIDSAQKEDSEFLMPQEVSTISNEYLGRLSIPTINLSQGFYAVDYFKNDVDYGLEIIAASEMPDVEGGCFIIAAHSGNSSVSYFKHLNQVNLNDVIYIDYLNKKYTYYIQKKYITDKNGKLNIEKNINESYLVLTTCFGADKQLVVIAKRINEGA